jgi:hypothetical protein
MEPQTLHAIDLAEEAATQLIEVCRKNSPLYRQRPKQATQVNRTTTWFLNALAS